MAPALSPCFWYRCSATYADCPNSPRIPKVRARCATPAALSAFFKTYHVDPLRWHAVRGSADDTREISVALGVRFKAIDSGDFAHSNLITLLGKDGTIIHRQQGLGAQPEELIKALRESLAP